MNTSRPALLSALPVIHETAAHQPAVPQFLSREACTAVLQRLHAFGLPKAQKVDIGSWWRGDVRWAQNRIHTTGDWRTNRVRMDQNLSFGFLEVNQVDVESLRAVVERYREDTFLFADPREPLVAWSGGESYPQTHIWSDATYTQPPEARTAVVTQAMATAEQAGMLSAGYLSVEARGELLWLMNGVVLYAPQTLAQCSMTVRDPRTQASGWAGASSYDWTRIDVAKVAAVALDKCLNSRNPVKLEPGRYTAILEPQAVYDLVSMLLNSANSGVYMGMEANEMWGFMDPPAQPLPFRDWPIYKTYPKGPFDGSDAYGQTRIGQQVIDSRFTLRSDPLDPDLGTLPFSYYPGGAEMGDPFVPVTWIEHGVLKTLATTGKWAVNTRRQQAQPWPFTPFHRSFVKDSGGGWSGAYRLEWSDPPVTIEEMISTTKRGLLVTHLWDIRQLSAINVLCTGVTRDGLWLIENGKISHPVTNFRFTESPLFVLNNVEQAGPSVPIFNPECPAVIPPLKVRDFSFTSLIDAI